jgi:S-DNA-T family DNA segregation ATPase FtsK/SpoIIIE
MTRSLKIGFTEAAKGEFRIFIESEKREAVPMWNLWKERKLERNKDGTNTKLILGLKELDGTILYLDPLSMDNEPHTLIAGGTGSGKSVLMRMMLLDIAATNNPDQAKIYIVDPKMGVDYGSLRKLPHMASPIVSEPDQSFQIFDEVIAEMNRRYALFAEEGNENLLDYNVHHPESKLPVIWLIHDELPQVMSDKDYNTEMSPKMKTLATKARAAGIFMILLAQRPDKDVLPPQIRDNLGNRLALKLPTEASSKIALDKSGAEFLLGKGHLAAKIGSRITYAQCPFLNREETKEAVQAIIEDNRKE